MNKKKLKNISCNCISRCYNRKFKVNQKWNNDKCRCECKNPIKYHVYKMDYVWSPSASVCEINKYLKIHSYMKSVIHDSLMACDEITEAPETVSINSNYRNVVYKMDYYFFHTLLLVTTLLLIIGTTCYYCIRHQPTQIII